MIFLLFKAWGNCEGESVQSYEAHFALPLSGHVSSDGWITKTDGEAVPCTCRLGMGIKEFQNGRLWYVNGTPKWACVHRMDIEKTLRWLP